VIVSTPRIVDRFPSPHDLGCQYVGPAPDVIASVKDEPRRVQERGAPQETVVVAHVGHLTPYHVCGTIAAADLRLPVILAECVLHVTVL
jgi:hypothetical protein